MGFFRSRFQPCLSLPCGLKKEFENKAAEVCLKRARRKSKDSPERSIVDVSRIIKNLLNVFAPSTRNEQTTYWWFLFVDQPKARLRMARTSLKQTQDGLLFVWSAAPSRKHPMIFFCFWPPLDSFIWLALFLTFTFIFILFFPNTIWFFLSLIYMVAFSSKHLPGSGRISLNLLAYSIYRTVWRPPISFLLPFGP